LRVHFKQHEKHRDLHSFPTRRSSDLWLTMSEGKSSGHPRTEIEATGPGSAAASSSSATDASRTTDARTSATRAASASSSGGSPRDRKSTRLNSSHSQISYAVFCLKKK